MSSVVECMKSELDIFQSIPVQASILKSEELCYNPVNTIENTNSLEFISLGHGDTYRDLSSVSLRLKIKVTKADSTALEAGAKVSVVNNFLHSIFRSCSVYFNNKLVSSSDGNYHYRAYIENLLNYGRDAVSTHLECDGWQLDTEGKMNLFDGDNKGAVARTETIKKSQVVELMGKVHIDVFNQTKLLLNNVDLKIVFTLEKEPFYMFEETAGTSKLQIMGAALHMRHLTISPNVLLAHNQILSRGTAVYNYKRTEVKTFTVPTGGNSISLDNAIVGQLPNVLIFTMVDNDAYTGSKREKNPFNFKHNNLTNFCLYVNGVQVPNHALETDFKTQAYTRAYRTLFTGTGIHNSDNGHQITKSSFANGYFMLAFDLTSDGAAYDACRSLLNQGTVSIEARFSEALPQTTTCIVYAEYDASVEIDGARNVYIV